ncbi:hypothetical protein TREMEDRAFT_58187 [Tremella mesenterica DSM 1558]|uniref:uncharacterized protein n=1 Tax=Tremella mesenterica (strain ATCC 24925 / CBS 8224 / DSM 1558 / NBRC 9311 / NRRL Y-6157 / RJB 2259-6 / UBC 559-6) TaxID=578456 RepID=UPI0003F4A0C3|nr:uncharacterized protein TREMEDRAFT_58187 [Tremella mesenterica DSM 1558]EIW72038.1 hypothetical protein TREMEDRAFT_58187 [Tremella mesenterica DSM 1558]
MSHDLETMLPDAVSVCRGHSTILLSHYPLPPIEKSTSLETRPTFRQLYSLRRPLPPSTPPRLVWSGSPEPEDSLPSPPFSDIGSGDPSHHHNDDDDISEQPHRSESPWRSGKLDVLADPVDSGVSVEVQAGGLVGFCSLKVVHAARSGKVPGKMPHNILKEALVLRQLGHPNVSVFFELLK